MSRKTIHIIIPAAGLGTRMRPLSNGISKALIPVNGRPILDWIIESVRTLDADIQDITIVTNPSRNDIWQFIESTYKGTEIYNKIRCIRQRPELAGPGGAVLSAIESLEYEGAEGILIWLGDTICKYSGFEFGKDPFVATADVDSTGAPRWCVAIPDDKTGYTYLNKPSIDRFRNATKIKALIGIYYLPVWIPKPELLEYRKEIEISQVLDTDLVQTIKDVTGYWYDCGELDSYYESKAKLLNFACREQSEIVADSKLGIIRKAGKTDKAKAKIHQELRWYRKRSGYQTLFLPKIIDSDTESYTMEIVPGNTLSDMFIYENIPMNVFFGILKNVLEIYHTHFARKTESSIDALPIEDMQIYDTLANEYYNNRPCMRLIENHELYTSLNDNYNISSWMEFINRVVIDIKKEAKEQYNKIEASPKSLFYRIESLKRTLPRNIIKETGTSTVHGDFHLGNILFDSFTGRFTFLDPYGKPFYKNMSDTYYDMAKLYHDIYCGYMLIIRNLYYTENGYIRFPLIQEQNMTTMVRYLDEYLEQTYGYNPALIKKLAIIQILTCIPFHSDNKERCKALLLRAMNLA